MRKIYLHFDRYGILNDGIEEGEEWTRNRRTELNPWDHLPRRQHSAKIVHRLRVHSSPGESIGLAAQPPEPRYPSQSAIQNVFRDVSTDGQGTLPMVGNRMSSSSRAMPPRRRRPSFAIETINGKVSHMTSTSLRPLRPSSREPHSLRLVSHSNDPSVGFPSSTAPLNGQSLPLTITPKVYAEGTSDLSSSCVIDSPRPSRRHARGNGALTQGSSISQWTQLDRYGFFDGKTTTSQAANGRLILLPAACFEIIPLAGSSGTSKVKNKVASRLALDTAVRLKKQLGFAADDNHRLLHVSMSKDKIWTHGPPSSTPTEEVSAVERAVDISVDKVLASFRDPASTLSKAKEARRIDKWTQMLEPASYIGGNASSYKVRTQFRNSVKLESRVFKGIPDRWRAAAWWALLESKWTVDPANRPVPEKFSGVRLTSSSMPVVNGSPQEAVGLDGSGHSPSHPNMSSAAKLSQETEITRASSLRNLRQVRHRDTDLARGHRSEARAAAIEANNGAQLPLPSASEKQFQTLLESSSPHDVQIDLDVPRTINNHIVFYTRYGLGQRSLFKVLHAFSLHCTECGYCQGMGGVAVTLLCYMEERACWQMLQRLHDAKEDFELHRTFAPGFPGLLESFYVQGQLLKLIAPRLAELLEREGVTASAYATRWYITLFYNVVPFETQLRLWDAVMLVGSRDLLPLFGVAILHAVGTTIFFPSSDRSVGGGGSEEDNSHTRLDFETILSTLSSSNLFVPESDDAMMRWVHTLLGDRIVRRTMRKARRQWASIAAKGEEAQWV